ncbi:MAG: hypothetical protein HAW67_05690 [Endozoicomonadaceae bacterium]|nr:hypothetical protein [Endozoicomonadaceae bacterium]
MKTRYADINVVVYFSGDMGNIYQIQQWLKPLEVLNKENRVLVIARNEDAYDWIQGNTGFPVAYCKTMTSLLKLYEDNDFKCVLYVNNAATNFQSLCENTVLHVHINHGESEKTSTFTNRAKAYDFTFIVADAAYEKYANNLLNMDLSKLVKIGRPQADFLDVVDGPQTDKKVILYAPTWEATHFSMNYTSLPDYGVSFVNDIIEDDDYYLIYRPHPNTGSRDLLTKQADLKIREIISHANNAIVMDKEDINSVFDLTDLAIFDNSAVTVDFLAFDKPMLMTDYFYRQKEVAIGKSKIITACESIDDDNYKDILTLIKRGLSLDPKAAQRAEIKRYFLGDYARGESTSLFVDKIKDIIRMREALVACQQQGDDVLPFNTSTSALG